MARDPRSRSHESRRDAATRHLAEITAPTAELMLPSVRAEHLDVSNGDSVAISHPLGEWGEAVVERRHMKVRRQVISPKNQTLGLGMLDWRGGRHNIGLRLGFNFTAAGQDQAGLASIAPHNGMSFTRSTNGWSDNPGGGAYVVAVEPDQMRPQYISEGRAGWISERRSRQLQLKSFSQLAALPARTGSGTTTNDILSLFNPPPFGLSDIHRIILTAGSPHATEGIQPYVATRAGTAGGFMTLSFHHQDDPGAFLVWVLYRASDNFYWNETTRVWNAASTRNTMPAVNTTAGLQVAARAIPSAASTYIVYLIQAAGGTAARKNYIHHVQLEEKRFESSPILLYSVSQENVPGHRDDDLLQVCNDSAVRTWLKERGTMLTRFIPRWSTADVDGLKMHVFAVEYDANNSITLFYDGINSTKNRFVLEVRAAGVTVTVAAAVAVTRNVEMKLGMRWASATYNELGGTYGTPAVGAAKYDLWLTDAVIASGEAAMPTETTTSRIQVACRDGHNIDGTVIDFTVLWSVLNDDEMAAAL